MTAKITQSETVYSGWIKVDRVELRMPDGALLERHIEDHGAAVTVLPYDPVRKLAVLVSLPRAPVIRSGESDLFEAIAGALQDECPEACARREALEEAGLKLTALEKISEVWSMPSFSTERIHLYLAAFTTEDKITDGGGAPGEHENITVHEIGLSDLWRLCEEQRLADMKTLLLVHALKLRHPKLF